MKALVIYESMYGNTREVALAIADGLGEVMEVESFEVGVAPGSVPLDTDLVVIGGPTHQFGMSRPSSRAQATERYDGSLVSATIGIREWIQNLREPGVHGLVATFSTVLSRPWFLRYFGNAGTSARRLLKKRGFTPVLQAEPFWVEGGQGPLAAGEIERAHSWGRQLGEAALMKTVAPEAA